MDPPGSLFPYWSLDRLGYSSLRTEPCTVSTVRWCGLRGGAGVVLEVRTCELSPGWPRSREGELTPPPPTGVGSLYQSLGSRLRVDTQCVVEAGDLSWLAWEMPDSHVAPSRPFMASSVWTTSCGNGHARRNVERVFRVSTVYSKV